jgi:hypothetical protein
LYNQYGSRYGKNIRFLWPNEKARWYELIFSILASVGEINVPLSKIRLLLKALVYFDLLDLGILAKINPDDDQGLKNPSIITARTLMQQVGFTPDMSKSAITAICKAASSIQEKYDGKIQNYFMSYGLKMMQQTKEDFGLNEFNNVDRALGIWLQNTLNMPIPVSDPLTDKICEEFGWTYSQLAKAANEEDLNIALLDDALRITDERTDIGPKKNK